MTLLIAALRGFLEALIVVDAALAVAWAWLSPDGSLRAAVVLAVMIIVAAAAAVGVAALPGSPRRERWRRRL